MTTRAVISLDKGDRIEGVSFSGHEWLKLGENDIWLGPHEEPEAIIENARRLIEAAQSVLNDATLRLAGAECACVDPICPKVHPVDRLDAIDEAKRAREIAEARA